MIDETDRDHGPFQDFEAALSYMLKLLNMTEEGYYSNYEAQELVYITEKEVLTNGY